MEVIIIETKNNLALTFAHAKLVDVMRRDAFKGNTHAPQDVLLLEYFINEYENALEYYSNVDTDD